MVPYRSDVALAVALALLQLVGSISAASDRVGYTDLDLTSALLLLAGPASIFVLRRRPDVTLGVSATALLLYLELGYPPGPVFASFVVGLFTTALAGRQLALLVAAGAWETWVVLDWLRGGFSLGALLGSTAWILFVLVSGVLVRVLRERGRQRAAVAEQTALARASSERLLIARELHDVLAHSISLISVQAGVALHLLDEQPGQAREALAAIKHASADGLRDLRRTVAVLRDGPSLEPTPGLEDLERLVTSARSAGLQVTCSTSGPVADVDAAVGLAAYRIVQESLTNVRRHAGTDRARVRVAYDGTALDVRVDDDGRVAVPLGPGGHGLQGMRERVATLGGELTTGPRSDGGFSVHAQLPA